MFNPIEIPFGCAMMFNVVNLKDGVEVSDVELTLGEMCHAVKENYGDDNGGFIGGQVYQYAGFVSKEGSMSKEGSSDSKRMNEDHLVIITYWQSFEQHEKSHADKLFNEKFNELVEFCDETYEIGYEMLWQGVPD